MYNGIGLQTARGSGTNGHVQRNLSFVRMGKKDNVKYKTEAELAKAETINNRPPNEEILEHERKRKIEVKILEFQDVLEEKDYTPEEIAAKVQAYRERLLKETSGEKDTELPKDEFGRYAVRETHQIAAAKHEKNAMLRSAFGISEYFVEGSSFDSDRKAKEELAKSAALQKELDAQRKAVDADTNKRYKLVRTPSKERDDGSGKKNDENKTGTAGKSDEKSGSKHKKKRDGKSNDRQRDSKKKRKHSSESDSSSSDEDDGDKKTASRKKPSRQSGGSKRKASVSSDNSSDSSSDSEPSKKRNRHSSSNSNNDRKKQPHHEKKSKKRRNRRRHSTSSSSSSSDSDSDSSSSSSSSSTSSSSSSSSSSGKGSSNSESDSSRKHTKHSKQRRK